VDKLYKPYDIGQVGQLDIHILAGIFGGEQAASDLTPAWNGGIYWAGQRRSAATAEEQNSTNSLALFYLSVWRNQASAQAFAKLYAKRLGHKYSGLKPDLAAEQAGAASLAANETEQVFTTNEGPVVITTRGKLVFTSESFPLELGRKLTELVLDAQGTGDLKMARSGTGAEGLGGGALKPVSAKLVRLMADCGVMKAAVDGAVRVH
jgi:hypothetical protein